MHTLKSWAETSALQRSAMGGFGFLETGDVSTFLRNGLLRQNIPKNTPIDSVYDQEQYDNDHFNVYNPKTGETYTKLYLKDDDHYIGYNGNNEEVQIRKDEVILEKDPLTKEFDTQDAIADNRRLIDILLEDKKTNTGSSLLKSRKDKKNAEIYKEIRKDYNDQYLVPPRVPQPQPSVDTSKAILNTASSNSASSNSPQPTSSAKEKAPLLSAIENFTFRPRNGTSPTNTQPASLNPASSAATKIVDYFENPESPASPAPPPPPADTSPTNTQTTSSNPASSAPAQPTSSEKEKDDLSSSIKNVSLQKRSKFTAARQTGPQFNQELVKKWRGAHAPGDSDAEPDSEWTDNDSDSEDNITNSVTASVTTQKDPPKPSANETSQNDQPAVSNGSSPASVTTQNDQPKPSANETSQNDQPAVNNVPSRQKKGPAVASRPSKKTSDDRNKNNTNK